MNLRRARSLIVLVGLGLMTSAAMGVTPGSASYTYDGIGRLIAVIYENGTGQVYTYDAAGNRQTSYSGTPAILSITPTISVSEGGTVTLTVTRSNGAVATGVNYQTVNGSAIAGTNYTTTSGTLNYTPSQTTQSLTVTTLNDAKFDGPLKFQVKLTPAAANAAISPSSATVTINEATAAPSFVLATPSSVVEGNTLNFTVNRSGATSLTQAVNYSTADGTAIAGVDYGSTMGSLSFGPTDTSKTFSVPTYYQTNYEGTRTFNATLAGATNGATIGTPSSTGTITDSDPAISFAINSPATVIEGNPITFTVTESGGTPGLTFNVNYATASGTAVSGTDFTAASGTLSYPPGTTTHTVIVTTPFSRVDTTLRTFTMTLSAATNNAPITTATGTGSIQAQNVPPAPSLTPVYGIVATGSPFYLGWTVNGGNPTSYKLWEVVPHNTLIYSGPNTTWSGTLPTKDYNFQVQACNANGCGAFSPQNEIDVCINGQC